MREQKGQLAMYHLSFSLDYESQWPCKFRQPQHGSHMTKMVMLDNIYWMSTLCLAVSQVFQVCYLI
jgi:hypothetical protein